MIIENFYENNKLNVLTQNFFKKLLNSTYISTFNSIYEGKLEEKLLILCFLESFTNIE